MLEIKIPVAIKYTDLETGDGIIVDTKIANSLDSIGKELTVCTYHWQDDSPRIRFIQFLLPYQIIIWIDRPCKIGKDGYLENLEKETVGATDD